MSSINKILYTFNSLTLQINSYWVTGGNLSRRITQWPGSTWPIAASHGLVLVLGGDLSTPDQYDSAIVRPLVQDLTTRKEFELSDFLNWLINSTFSRVINRTYCRAFDHSPVKYILFQILTTQLNRLYINHINCIN